MSGLSTMGSISFGLALVAGRNRVPRPATGNTATSIRLCFFAGMGAPFFCGPQTYHACSVRLEAPEVRTRGCKTSRPPPRMATYEAGLDGLAAGAVPGVGAPDLSAPLSALR